MIPHFFQKILAAKNGDLSSTRLCLLVVTGTLCAFAWAIIFRFSGSGVVPEIPAGTGAFFAGMLGLLAILKGVQNKQENEGTPKP